MPLRYHHNTYGLLTQSHIDPQKVIEEESHSEANFIASYSITGQNAEATLKRQAEERQRRLIWTNLALYQRPVQFSEKNSYQLDLLEQRHNVKLPAAVREWYSLDIAPDIMTVRGWGPISIDQIGPLSTGVHSEMGAKGDRLKGEGNQRGNDE